MAVASCGVSAPRVLSLPPAVDAGDLAVDRWWERLRGDPTIDRVFYTASTVGDFSVIWHAVNLACLASGVHGPRAAVRLAAALGAESIIVNQGLKRLFRRERPEAVVHAVHRLRTPSTTSCPSGHASSAALAAVLLAGGRRTPAVVALATVVATSRVHVRIHHASDVAAGAVVGAALGAAVRALVPLGATRGRAEG